MAEVNHFLEQTHQCNPTLQSFVHVLDPISLILNQNSTSSLPLQLQTETYILERGPRYRAYAELRESMLRMKNASLLQAKEDHEKSSTPPPLKKQVRFQGNLGSDQKKGCSVLAQSVPDFSAVLRKENRKPVMTTPPPPPPLKSFSKVNGVGSNSRGSKSVNAGEKKGGLMMGRKSYASLEELKGFSCAARNKILNNGENRGGKSSCGERVMLGRSTTNFFGYRI